MCLAEVRTQRGTCRPAQLGTCRDLVPGTILAESYHEDTVVRGKQTENSQSQLGETLTMVSLHKYLYQENISVLRH